MKKIGWLIFLIGFLLFRPYQFERGILYSGDDLSYFAHATALVYGQFPSYEKEYFTDGDQYPKHLIGPAIAALPFVATFSMADRLAGRSIVARRSSDNLADSWTLYGFVVSSVFYLCLGCLLLYRGLREHTEEWTAVLAVFLMVLCEGIPLFAFRRPVFSHISMFCIQSAFVCWFLVPPEKRWPWLRGLGGGVVAGLLAGLILLTRPNNLLFALLWPVLVLWPVSSSENKRLVWPRLAAALGTAALACLLFWMLIGVSPSYVSEAETRLLASHPFIWYVKRPWHILTGLDWGLIFSAPFVLFGVAGIFCLSGRLKGAFLWSLIPVASTFYLVMSWQTQGGWYGYRYLIPTAIPVLIYPFAILLERASQRCGRGAVLAFVSVWALLPLGSMLLFENAQGLTLQQIEQYFGVSGWGNNLYQLNVWKTIFETPLTAVALMCKGGPLYVAMLLREIGGREHIFPHLQQQVYDRFSLELFVKTLLIYALPLLFSSVLAGGKKK